MTTIPQLRIPDIFVEDDEGLMSGDAEAKMRQFGVDTGADEQRKLSWHGNTASGTTTQSHPLGLPRSSLSINEEPRGSSTFSFELETPDIQDTTAAELERPADNSNLASVQDMLDGSVWIDSIRRSTTLRATDRSSYRYDDLP